MINPLSSSRNPKELISASLFEWWRAKSQYEFTADHYFNQVEDEWIISNTDDSVGFAIMKIRDFWTEFLQSVEDDPAAKFIYENYCLKPSVKRWIAQALGRRVRGTDAYKKRLSNIKRLQRKLKTVKGIIES